MSKTEPQLEALIHSLKAGTPRAAYRARQELSELRPEAESAIIRLLTEVEDPHRILDVLGVLQKTRLSNPVSVDSVVRLLSHRDVLVRRAAAHCLLTTSPKLSHSRARIRAAVGAEKDGRVVATLQKLLDR